MGMGFWLALLFAGAAFIAGLMIGTFDPGPIQPCTPGESTVECLRSWQGIIAGILALGAAAPTVYFLRLQIKALEGQHWRQTHQVSLAGMRHVRFTAAILKVALREIPITDRAQLKSLADTIDVMEMSGLAHPALHDIAELTGPDKVVHDAIIALTRFGTIVTLDDTSDEMVKRAIENIETALDQLLAMYEQARSLMIAGASSERIFATLTNRYR